MNEKHSEHQDVIPAQEDAKARVGRIAVQVERKLKTPDSRSVNAVEVDEKTK